MDLNSFLKLFTPEERRRIMFLDGITKSLGGSNIRYCHLIAEEAVIKFITARASHGVIPSFFSLAVAMAAYELGLAEAAKTIIEPTNASRVVLKKLLADSGLQHILGKGYYAFMNVGEFILARGWADTEPLGQYLAENFGVAVVPGAFFSPSAATGSAFPMLLAPRPGDHIVEIGPGKGALTRELAAQLEHFDAVELDRDLLAHLQATIPAGKLTLHGADALKYDFCQLTQEGRKLRLVGNLPYNISTPLLFHLLDQAGCIQDMLFMLQKVVVHRMAASPGGKDYGRLSVMIQYRCTVEKLFDVAPGAFTPPPKVDSSVVRLIPHATPPVAVND